MIDWSKWVGEANVELTLYKFDGGEIETIKVPKKIADNYSDWYHHGDVDSDGYSNDLLQYLYKELNTKHINLSTSNSDTKYPVVYV